MQTRIPQQFLGRLRIVSILPPELKGLAELSMNLWWSWSPLARKLFRLIDKPTWIQCQGNPRIFLRRVKQATMDSAARNPDVLALYERVMKMFNEYRKNPATWFDRTYGDRSKVCVAYFSMEFGLHESLPNYSGGLGILAGDHIKSATDLGVPFLAMGLLYREGYFVQGLDDNGAQTASYERHEWEDLPVMPAKDKDGHEVRIQVEIAGRTVHAKVWEVHIGRNPLFLLDTDIEENLPDERRLTARLYGGDQDTRIQQEILLGIGGIRALRRLGHTPTVFHMNEGHSVFLGLERLREFIQNDGLSFAQALEMVRATTLFTTHTPVPAGNDAFDATLMEKYFRRFWEGIGLTRQEFLDLGYERTPEGREHFSLTVLALRLSGMANGVSAIHGEVSRRLWSFIWPNVPVPEAPIDHITNGVHTLTWMSFDMQELMDRHLPADWRSRVMEPTLWESLDKVPDNELFETMNEMKVSMVNFIHDRLTRQHERFGESPEKLREIEQVFSADALTIGFARRFATYKRATLLFRDRDRLKRILNTPGRPVQLVFAGKAHPADKPGQEFIKAIVAASKEEGFRNKIVFIENYDQNVGRRLTSGVDVWLNNPRRPLEASGTSGMKVPLNAGLNFSILDGWWPEAWHRDPLVGWAIGEEKEFDNLEQQDEADAESLYRILEQEIIPLYFQRDKDGVPREWLRRVRASMKTIAPAFSTDRMVSEYVARYYVEGSKRFADYCRDGFARAKETARWKASLKANWAGVRLRARTIGAPDQTVKVKTPIEVVAEVDLGSISPEDVSVEIYIESLNPGNGKLPRVGRVPMRADGRTDTGFFVYRGELMESESGEFGYTVRVIPNPRLLVNPQELGLVRWA